MSLQKYFKKDHSLFIPFIMAGHPTLEATDEILLGLSALGADIIELGVPFSDPVADGPVNQSAADVALRNGTTLEHCLESVARVRQHGCQTPIILFSYLNPILAMGIDRFSCAAHDAGVNGVLFLDLPPEENEAIHRNLQAHKLEIILLASPTTALDRLASFMHPNVGFVYYISRLGVTGIQTTMSDTLQTEFSQIRQALTCVPICVGFGISTPEQAQHVAGFADGVIVGSALVQTLDTSYPTHGLDPFLTLSKQLADAIHGARTKQAS